MNYLRQISETNGNHGRDDDSAGSIGFVRANNDYASDDYDGLGGYVVMAWYKNRGGTGNAHFMDDNETHLLTIDHVDMALATNRFDMEAI
jgi:hypothetical protein